MAIAFVWAGFVIPSNLVLIRLNLPFIDTVLLTQILILLLFSVPIAEVSIEALNSIVKLLAIRLISPLVILGNL